LDGETLALADEVVDSVDKLGPENADRVLKQ
jgi:hypothetical protein